MGIGTTLLNLLPVQAGPNGEQYRLKPGPKAWAVGAIVGGTLLGAVLFIFAFAFTAQSRGASAEPTVGNLAEIEKGKAAPNNHIQFNDCNLVYPQSFFWYETYGKAPPTAGSKVNSTFVPVISASNGYLAQVRALAKKYGAIEKIPPKEFPPIKNFVVLLRTERFSSAGEIPGQIEKVPELHGLINNHMVGLEDEERDLIKKSFPGVDVDKILIVLEGRGPITTFQLSLLIGGGALLILGPLAYLILVWRKPMRIKVPVEGAVMMAASPARTPVPQPPAVGGSQFPPPAIRVPKSPPPPPPPRR